jgi:8-oxo-dGTP pyrophosphatase MutT (NUDIX family)
LKYRDQCIAAALRGQPPTLIDKGNPRRASVALLLSQSTPDHSDDPAMLLIKRAVHPRDPWSGHLAFPGGRYEDEDGDLVTTARRETLEEVGVDLGCHRTVRLLGQLDDLAGRARGKSLDLVISCFVFAIALQPQLTLNYEVADYFWLPLSACVDPDRQMQHFPRGSPGERYPGIYVGAPADEVLWGLTYRFTHNLFKKLGVALP